MIVPPEPLSLTCCVMPRDTMQVDSPTDGVCLRIFTAESSSSVFLDDDDVRRLFNYLGLVLHRQGSAT